MRLAVDIRRDVTSVTAAFVPPERRRSRLEPEGDRVTTELQAAYAAGKAAAAFDRARIRGLRTQLAGIERETGRLQGRLDSISRAFPEDDDGWHH